MNYKIKKIFTNPRVIILIIFLLLSAVAINPQPFNKGIAIKNVITNSSASLAGITQTKPNLRPTARERILEINNKPIKNVKEYYDIVNELKPNQSMQIKTNKGLYRLTTREEFDIIELNETITKSIIEKVKVNKTINGTLQEVEEEIQKTIQVPKTKRISKGVDLGIRIAEAPQTNLRKGLDLQGGTRVLLQPEKMLTKYDLGTLIDTLKERLNVYGLSDLIITDATDLSGNQYILVEIAGASEEEIKNLVAREGKFEAKIGNDTVFRGGRDITFVCRSANCAGIDPNAGGCGPSGSAWACRFRFSISLSKEAAQRQADATKDLSVIKDQQGSYLSEKLELFLDDKKVDELSIAADLKGQATTDIQISGSGIGSSEQESVFNSLNNMKRLQTVLITGSLPVKLNIVKIDTISPILGEEFVNNTLLIGLIAILSVSLVVFLKYKKFQVIVPMAVIMVSEVIMLLGVAALIGWNLDLAAIAGIIITIGTGINHQIIIADETLKGISQTKIFNWKERIKGAFSIIMGSYLTVVVAMIPLIFAGAGLLKGFAITTIIGASIGVFVSRPVYASLVEILLKE